MNKNEWVSFVEELKKEYKKKGYLSEEEKDILDKNKKIAIDKGFITSNDLNEISKMVVNVKESKTDTKKGPQMNFAGRGGPRNFGSVEKAKDSKGTISRLFLYFKSEVKLIIGLFLSNLTTVQFSF